MHFNILNSVVFWFLKCSKIDDVDGDGDGGGGGGDEKYI